MNNDNKKWYNITDVSNLRNYVDSLDVRLCPCVILLTALNINGVTSLPWIPCDSAFWSASLIAFVIVCSGKMQFCMVILWKMCWMHFV